MSAFDQRLRHSYSNTNGSVNDQIYADPYPRKAFPTKKVVSNKTNCHSSLLRIECSKDEGHPFHEIDYQDVSSNKYLFQEHNNHENADLERQSRDDDWHADTYRPLSMVTPIQVKKEQFKNFTEDNNSPNFIAGDGASDINNQATRDDRYPEQSLMLDQRHDLCEYTPYDTKTSSKRMIDYDDGAGLHRKKCRTSNSDERFNVNQNCTSHIDYSQPNYWDENSDKSFRPITYNRKPMKNHYQGTHYGDIPTDKTTNGLSSGCSWEKIEYNECDQWQILDREVSSSTSSRRYHSSSSSSTSPVSLSCTYDPVSWMSTVPDERNDISVISSASSSNVGRESVSKIATAAVPASGTNGSCSGGDWCSFDNIDESYAYGRQETSWEPYHIPARNGSPLLNDWVVTNGHDYGHKYEESQQRVQSNGYDWHHFQNTRAGSPNNCYISICRPIVTTASPLASTQQNHHQTYQHYQQQHQQHQNYYQEHHQRQRPSSTVVDRRVCKFPNCTNRIVQGGVCISHGAKRKKCGHPGCTKHVKKAGFCSAHGPPRKKCSTEGCNKVSVNGGKCITHGACKKMCVVEGCDKQGVVGGMCKKHNNRRLREKK